MRMPSNSPWWRALGAALPGYAALILIVLVGARMTTSFATTQNLANIGLQSTPLALAALAETIVVVSAGIDLSVGSVISLATTMMAVWSQHSPWLTTCSVLAMGLGVGLINGAGVSLLRIPPLIMTLGTMTLVSGAALFVLPSPGGAVTPLVQNVMYAEAGVLSLPLVVILLATAILAWLTIQTRWGLHLYAAGARPVQAASVGVPVEKVTIQAYALAGLVAAVAGLAMAGTLGSGDPNAGNLITLNAIAAVVLGGTALTGGKGGVIGSLGGALLLGVVANLLNQANVNPSIALVVEGGVVLAAVILQRMRGRFASRPEMSA